MRRLDWWKTAGAVCVLCAATAIAVPAQTFRTLQRFDHTDGAAPGAGLVEAANGNLYGTTSADGANDQGTVFEITPSGKLTTLYSFCSQSACADGASPLAGLVQGPDGNLYGTTESGGANGYGTVFKIAISGALTAVYNFCHEAGCIDGAGPQAGLILANDGNFYGTTAAGGAQDRGTVFKVTAGGSLTTLYSFCFLSGCEDGVNPYGGLVQASDGNLYGTTFGDGGGFDGGTVFKITPSGTLTTLYSFCTQSGCADGKNPMDGLIQASDGNLYGTTSEGGPNGNNGTAFRITLSGTLVTLYNFCSETYCVDGSNPYATLVQATDGNLYGTTYYGGSGTGTAFEITLSGTLTTLYSFCSERNCSDGAHPWAPLFQDTNGRFYGTTYEGGASDVCIEGCGTVFSLSVGLGPFVETQPTSGKAGALVKILGTDLTGATSVTFNGTAATFTVESRSAIKTTVPEGATSGKVQVVTPGGTLSSNVPFRVEP